MKVAFSRLRLIEFRLLAICLTGVCFVALSATPNSADEPASSVTIYDADPQHLWNRLHHALFVRTGPDGRTYGEDSLEPLLWNQTNHLLEGHSNVRALAVLDEFVEGHGRSISFHEFRLSRTRLFADQAGGFRAIGSDEREFKTGFRSHAYDVFELSEQRPFP